MSRPETNKYLEKWKRLKPSDRSRLTKNLSFETWNVDLAIIKAERIRKRIIAIRRTIYIAIGVVLVWHSLNLIALLYAMYKELHALVHFLGLAFNLLALFAIGIFYRSVKLKSMAWNTVFYIQTWFHVISTLLINLVLLALFFGTTSQSNYLTQEVVKYELNFNELDLISSVILFIIYLALIVLLSLMRGSIFESKKYNLRIERAMEDKNQQNINPKTNEESPEVKPTKVDMKSGAQSVGPQG